MVDERDFATSSIAWRTASTAGRLRLELRAATKISRRSIRYAALFAATGHPAVTFPAGTTADGLPLAAQLVGQHGRDVDLLAVAHAYERVTAWHKGRPELETITR